MYYAYTVNNLLTPDISLNLYSLFCVKSFLISGQLVFVGWGRTGTLKKINYLFHFLSKTPFPVFDGLTGKNGRFICFESFSVFMQNLYK
jgi:hypothetical protein